MTISITQSTLQQALSIVARAVPSKPSLPILTSILVTATEQSITLAATDLYTGIETTLAATVQQPDKFVVPGKIFSEVINSLPEGEVLLRYEAPTLTLQSGGVKSSFQCQAIEDYPAFPKVAGMSITVATAEIEKVLKNVSFAVSHDINRPILTGILFDAKHSPVKAVATDGFRLAIQPLSPTFELSESILFPAKNVAEVLKIAQQYGCPEISIHYDQEQRQMLFLMGDNRFTCRLLDGEFPPYEKIFPQELTTEVLIDAEDLASHIKRALIFSRDASNIVQFEISQTEMLVKASSPSAGTYESKVVVESKQRVDEQTVKIAFNGKYLLDFLSLVKDKQVLFGMKDPLKPALFSVEGETGYYYVVMPFRVTEVA